VERGDIPEMKVSKQLKLKPVELSMEYRLDGGVDIKLNDFVYVSVNYSYRYTNNDSRAKLAEYIVKYLKGECSD
jgi:hypothetical protein